MGVKMEVKLEVKKGNSIAGRNVGGKTIVPCYSPFYSNFNSPLLLQ